MTNEEEAAHRAEAFRAEHALGTAPIGDIFEFAHAAARIDVFSMDSHESEHGLSMIDPDSGRVVIAVATMANPMRQRSSVAHELCHVIAGDLEGHALGAPGVRSREEVRADAFARHLLLPLAALRERFSPGHTVTTSEFSGVVQEFGLSPQMAAIQLREANLIDAATCTSWSARSTPALAAQNGWLSQYQALAEIAALPRAPQTLMARSAWAYKQGLLGLAELAAWYGQRADDLVDQLGEPEPPNDREDGWDASEPLFDAGGQ